MTPKIKKKLRSCIALTSAMFLSVSVLPVFAEDSVDTLKDKTSTLQNQLSGLNNELSAISSDMDRLLADITTTTEQVSLTKAELGEALATEEKQYNNMKMRIRYMYEEGQTALLDTLFSAVSMADFLNRADYITQITDYDRAMLKKLQEIRESIAAKEAELEKEQERLTGLQQELEQKKVQLSAQISSTSGELSSYQAQLERAIAAEKAAQEALAKKAEEEKQAALEKEQQANAAKPKPPVQETPSGGSGTNKPDNSGGSKPDNSGSGKPDSGSNNTSKPAQTGDVDLFAAILQCEAGSKNYDALLAVATVIMNRMESSRYPNTLHGVIYQSGQFSPTWNGSLNKVLKNGAASLCYTVARDALGGARHPDVRNCYQFRASYTGHQGIIIGGNVFF